MIFKGHMAKTLPSTCVSPPLPVGLLSLYTAAPPQRLAWSSAHESEPTPVDIQYMHRWTVSKRFYSLKYVQYRNV